MPPEASITSDTLLTPTRRVLLVEDDRAVFDVMAVTIHLLGYEVERAYSVKHALAIASRFRPDAVFIDLKLAGQDGFDLARRLIAQQCRARLIALAAFTNPEFRAQADSAGFDLVLAKPITADQLADALSTPKAANEG